MARAFSGSGQYATLPASATKRTPSSAMSVSVWVYCPSGGASNWNQGNYARLAVVGDYSDSETGWSLGGDGTANDNAVLEWYLWNSTTGWDSCGAHIPALDQWTHQFCSGTSGGTFEAWENNVSKGTVTHTIRTVSTKPLTFGINGKDFTGNAFKGRLAHFALWSVVLTADERAALAAGVDPLLIRPDALVTYESFEGTEIDLPNSDVLSVTGATVIDGPRIFRRRPRRRRGAGAGGTTYTVSGSGGAAGGGASSQTRTLTRAGAGGGVGAGAAGNTKDLTRSGAGGAVGGGAAGRTSELTRAAAGGATGGGAADRQLTLTRTGGGGAVGGGAAGVTFTGTTTVSGDGGAVGGGAAARVIELSRSGAGGAVVGGAAAHVVERTATASGGAALGGTAVWSIELTRSGAGGAAGGGTVGRIIELTRAGAGGAVGAGAASYQTITVAGQPGPESRLRGVGGLRLLAGGGVRAGRRR